MELWQVKKEYRQVAAALRRRKQPMDVDLEQIEEQVLTTVALCDRYETELAVLRLARRCARARLGRLRRWVERAGLMKSVPRPLARKQDEPAVEDLIRALERKGRQARPLRQLLDELTYLDGRLEETRGRLARTALQGASHLELLLTHLRVRRASTTLEPPAVDG